MQTIDLSTGVEFLRSDDQEPANVHGSPSVYATDGNRARLPSGQSFVIAAQQNVRSFCSFIEMKLRTADLKLM